MKHINITIILSAAALMLVACVKSEIEASVEKENLEDIVVTVSEDSYMSIEPYLKNRMRESVLRLSDTSRRDRKKPWRSIVQTLKLV